MAGLRISVFVSVVSFLLGLLFTHWIADSLTLWKSPATQTDLRLWTSATYYSILSRMPLELLYLYGGVVVLGGATLLWSLGDGRAGNLMFDGGSAVLYGTAIAVYLYSVLPNIFANFTALPLPFASASQSSAGTVHVPPEASSFPPFPPSLRGPTFELASSHLVCSVALTGVLALQAGRWWAEQKDVEDGEVSDVDAGKEKKD
ncbi:hypothetical protein EIP91_002757 [Steccherinum ochraceum]|uniref:Shr3 amino acid permease chaperone n=1 Tax=Steccherinum ochraceum TaxID=92696 RepID=A0A4R0RK15_9APHY|nr:hypothetical protein EIP91_002757 [Steccherinum ochraceum]